jgi:hypothetical protein
MAAHKPSNGVPQARGIDSAGQPNQHLGLESGIAHATDCQIDRAESHVERIERLAVDAGRPLGGRVRCAGSLHTVSFVSRHDDQQARCRIFPLAVRGKAATNSIRSGTL